MKVLTEKEFKPKWKKFRKKPVVISAVRVEQRVRVLTREGEITAYKGDWIIKGIEGEIYPCNHEIFLKTYDKVNK